MFKQFSNASRAAVAVLAVATTCGAYFSVTRAHTQEEQSAHALASAWNARYVVAAEPVPVRMYANQVADSEVPVDVLAQTGTFDTNVVPPGSQRAVPPTLNPLGPELTPRAGMLNPQPSGLPGSIEETRRLLWAHSPFVLNPHDRLSELLRTYGSVNDESARAKLIEEVSQLVNQQFDVRQQARAAELARLENELGRLRATHERRASRKGDIVGDRVKQLLRDADGLGWGSGPESGMQIEWALPVPQNNSPVPIPSVGGPPGFVPLSRNSVDSTPNRGDLGGEALPSQNLPTIPNSAPEIPRY